MEKTGEHTERNIIKVVLTGPESTGKSTLTKQLSEHFNTAWVGEYLRDFANDKYSHNKELVYSDNLLIAEGQIKLENEALTKANKILFCDTDILQTIIYSDEYYSKVQSELEEILVSDKDTFYLLLNLDVEWVYDRLRDKPNEREKMLDTFEKTLMKYNKRYIVLKGKNDLRLKNAIQEINKLLMN